MKIIKFRGKDIQTGKFIYGDLIHSLSEKGGVLISEERPISTPARWVYPDSVAQLIGYDADGAEVYEGDALVDEEGMPINSLYVGIIDSDSNAIDGEIGDQFGDGWLEKE